MTTYACDHQLPPLPVPPLDETADGLKARIEPIVSPADFSAFCRELDAFCAPAGVGADLQEKLLAHRDSLPHNSSWLRPFWDDGYISYQDSLPRNLHYTLQLRADKWSPDALPRFAAAMACTIQRIRREEIPTEMSGGKPISMDTIGSMFYTRIPAPLRDFWYHPRLTDPLTAAVVCRGHWFILSLTDDEGLVRSPAVLGDAFLAIRRQAEALPAAAGVSAFTCAPRETALALRTALSRFLQNRLSLEAIEKAVFAVSLDEDGAEEIPFGHSVLAGDAQNRFFDKAFGLISSGERLGASLEHSGCDGITFAYVFGQADEGLRENRFRYSESTAPAHLRLLDWYVPDELAAKLAAIREDFAVWSRSMRTDQKRLNVLAKPTLKALQCSPDAAVQLLFQCAYYRCAGTLRSVYEAVSTRGFYAGRTECVRSGTAASLAFLKAFYENAPGEVLLPLFRAAVDTHSENLARAKAGLGCERHMTGLTYVHQMFYPERPLPALFETAGYHALKHDSLSTSSIPGSAVDYFAFVPVVQDGLGLGYALYESGLHVALSSYPESGIHPGDFIRALEEAGERLLGVLT